MQGHGHDESAPTPCGVFVGYFVCEWDILRCVSWCVSWEFVAHSQNVRNVFIICMLHNRHSKVWFLRCKSMVFGVQKGGFWLAKVWFL